MTLVLLRKLNNLWRFGFFRYARIRLDRAFLGVLARVYKFHPWHAEAPTSARPYRHTIAKLVSNLKPSTVVEVGCGLGFILALIDSPRRFGYDVDAGVIRAARFLHGTTITFVNGDMKLIDLPNIDVLILVNWIHEISPDELEQLITPLLSRTRYLLLDAIDPDGPGGYRYKHDFAFLTSRAQRVSVTRPPNEGRSFHLFEVMA